MKNVSLLTLVALLFSLNACQKESISPFSNEETLVQSEKATALQNIVSIPDMPKTNQPLELGTRAADLSDIKDTLVPTIEPIITCLVFNDDCIETQLKLRRINSIKPGYRIGKLSTVNLESPLLANRKSVYTYHSDQGVLAMGGYHGKESGHPLNIAADGHYRIQMSPLSATHNLDVFVYKLEVKNNKIDSTLVTYSTLPAGETETVHITKKGCYTIVVDEKSAAGLNTDYLLAVSPYTSIKTTSFMQNSDLIYKFELLIGISIYHQTGWSFRKKINGVWTNLGTFPTESNFVFNNCSTCDYLVAPIFRNNVSGEIVEGKATLIHP